MEKERLAGQLTTLRAQQSELDNRRRKEVAAYKRNNRELENEVVKIEGFLEHLAADDQLNVDLRGLEYRASDAALAKEAFVRQLPAEFPREELTGEEPTSEQLDRAFTPEAAEAEDTHEKNLSKLQAAHAEECGAVQLPHQQRLSERTQACFDIAAATEDFKVRAQHWQRQLQSDLIAAHALAQQLSRLLDGIEAGVPSRDGKSDLAPLLGTALLDSVSALMEGSCDLPAQRSSEWLFRQISELRKRVEKHKHLPPPPDGLVRCGSSAGGSGGAAENEGGAWDAGNFAKQFCSARSTVAPAPGSYSSVDGPPEQLASSEALEMSLRRLTAPKLWALCLALRDRIRFGPARCEAERKQLREGVARELSSHGRVERIYELEREIAEYRRKRSDEEDRTFHLEIAAQSCARGIASRPSSAGTRLASGRNPRPASAGPALSAARRRCTLPA